MELCTMKTLVDQFGTSHTFENPPQRVISLVPSQTELLYDLGLKDKIVGITKFCIHPADFRQKTTIVGGTKKVNFEKIRKLKPDIILCNKEENTQEMVLELRKVCPVWVTEIYTIDDNLQMIADFEEIFNCIPEAQLLIEKSAFALSDFKDFIKDKPIRKVAYFIWKNPYMVAGSNNFINEMLQLNHFQNTFDRHGRYPEIELQKLKDDLIPEIVLLSSEPYPFKNEDADEIKRFLPNAKIIHVDGELFSWYGSRLLQAFAYFKKIQLEL